jgi:hypothetical protein
MRGRAIRRALLSIGEALAVPCAVLVALLLAEVIR